MKKALIAILLVCSIVSCKSNANSNPEQITTDQSVEISKNFDPENTYVFIVGV